MRHAAWLLIVGLLPARVAVAGEIIVDEQYEPYEPIEAVLEASYPEGARVDGGWECSTAEIRATGSLDRVHAWAPPGRHAIRFRGVWLQTRQATIDGETVRILQDFGFLTEHAAFEVGDGPDPPPPPPPENRWGIIVEETSRRTPEHAALWSRATHATTLNELMIVDQDSRAASLEPYQAAAAEFVRRDDMSLPVLVLVSSADGSVIKVMECPESVAAIKRELGDE